MPESVSGQSKGREPNCIVLTTGVGDMRDIKALLLQLASDDVLMFFNLYECVMLNNMECGTWARFLPVQLSPRALKVYTSNKLSMRQSIDYDCVKATILNNFNL